jgi:hypothetical protein
VLGDVHGLTGRLSNEAGVATRWRL